ncbi:putative ABC transporter permease protein [Klebsiella pneumoniae IS22]|nr:putative ABC transporter permease protein [Klebsiella pneumoniae IS22]
MARAIALTIIFEAAVLYLNQGRGIPWIFGLFVACVMILNYALKRTKWGRSMFAVGGNREAARRSGINVRAIYVSAFVLCTTLATFGAFSRRRDWLPPASRPAPATSTSTPSPRR